MTRLPPSAGKDLGLACCDRSSAPAPRVPRGLPDIALHLPARLPADRQRPGTCAGRAIYPPDAASARVARMSIASTSGRRSPSGSRARIARVRRHADRDQPGRRARHRQSPRSLELLSSPKFPYGKRQMALPIWAHSRGKLYPTVVFQDVAPAVRSLQRRRQPRLSRAILVARAVYCRPLMPSELSTRSPVPRCSTARRGASTRRPGLPPPARRPHHLHIHRRERPEDLCQRRRDILVGARADLHDSCEYTFQPDCFRAAGDPPASTVKPTRISGRRSPSGWRAPTAASSSTR